MRDESGHPDHRFVAHPSALIPSIHPSALLAALVLGAATVLGFAPFYLFPLPVLSLAGLFWLWERAADSRAAALTGFGFGLGLFGAGTSWIYVSLHDFGAMPAALAASFTFLFCALLALFPAAVGWIQARLPLAALPRFALAVPALWTLSDWSRSWFLTGFPWLAAGYSQVPASPLAGIAAVLGVFGVSLAVAMSAGLLLTLFEGRRQKAEGRARPISSFFLHPSASFLLALWLGGFALKQVEWTQPQGEPVKVSLLQGNIAQDLKWRPERALATLDAYLRLAQEAEGRLVILPETALPLFLHEVPPEYLEALASRVRAAGGDLLAGMPELTGPGEYYNSMVSFGASPTRVYRKHHLVPFGEFVPLRPLLGWVMDWLQIPLGDFSRGPALQAPLAVAGQKVAMNICYEDAFGEEIIRQLPEATLLANVTNDAWFGRSLGPQQHLQIAQARALETGRYLVRATNTGVTAFIDPRGRVLARAPEFTATRLEAEVTGYGGATPYVRWGNGAVLLVCGTVLLVPVAATRKRTA